MLFGSLWSLLPGPDRRKHEKGDKNSLEKGTRVSSDFGRQKIVEGGLLLSVCSSFSLSSPGGRLWLFSSVKLYYRVLQRVSAIAFERGSTTKVIGEAAFQKNGLR
jgi:hypothetical protein